MSSVRNENTQFIDPDTSEPINNGYIYIGLQNLDPVLNEKTIYPDRALAGIPLGNPQRTGTDGRSLNKIWVEGKYSIKVTDSAGVQKLLDLDRGEDTQIGNSLLINSLGVNDVVVTGSPTIQTLVDNQTYIFTAPAANTGAMTLQIDSLSAKPILKAHDEAMISGDVKEDQKLVVVYNGDDDTFEMQSAIASSSFGSITVTNDATIGGDITAVGTVCGVDLNAQATMATDSFIGRDTAGAGAPEILSATQVKDILYPATVTNHIRAGNTQVIDGSVDPGFFDVDGNVTQVVFETVGPTGSGATNIWTALDDVPTSATMVIVRAFLTVTPDSTAGASIVLFAAPDGVTPSINASVIATVHYDADASITGHPTGSSTEVLIPLGAGRIFQTTWNENNAGSQGCTLYYRGFIAD